MGRMCISCVENHRCTPVPAHIWYVWRHNVCRLVLTEIAVGDDDEDEEEEEWGHLTF